MRVECSLSIPCLFDAQADKVFYNNSSHNLKLICNFINEMKWKSVSVFHPHNPEVLEALIDNVKIKDNIAFISNVLGKILNTSKFYFNFNDDQKKILCDNLMLMSTDAGGFKPLIKLADKLGWKGEIYSASKSRKYENNESKLIQFIDKTGFNKKDILIIDDLCINGGTFIGLSKLLRERNVGKLFLAVSHITIEQPNLEVFKCFDKVFTTNSKGFDYHYYDGMNMRFFDNLEIIKLFD